MNISDEKTTLIAVRNAGIRGSNPGESYGGTYYPPVIGPDGSVQVSARFVCNVFINRKGRRDQDGNLIEGRRDIIPLTFWNTRNSAPGKGLADIAAKCISEGKEFTCRAELHSYDKKIFDNGQPVMKADGTGQLTTRGIGYTVEPGSLILGDDSEKIIAREVQSFNGQMNFLSRPQFWNVSGHEHNTAWKQISQWRMAQQYVAGQGTYGYARVHTTQNQQAVAGPSVTAQSVAGAVATPSLPATNVYPQGTVINGVDMSGQPAGSMPQAQPVLTQAAGGAPTVF